MDISVLVWILAAAVLLPPLLQRRLLESARRRLRERIERDRGSRVILLVHREERMSLFGFNLMRSLDVQDSEEIVRAILRRHGAAARHIATVPTNTMPEN